MIPYNTELKKLVLPEYGRLIHDMVELCMTLEDREERNAFAATIVETMKSMTQEKGKYPDDRKYWDHLFIISDFQLDVDSPFGKMDRDEINRTPAKIPYASQDFARRHYGRILQKMVKNVALMPNSEEKDACVELLANHIKKLSVINNSEQTDNEQVFAELSSLSDGSIEVGVGVFDLPEYMEDKPVKNQKKKKNRQ